MNLARLKNEHSIEFPPNVIPYTDFLHALASSTFLNLTNTLPNPLTTWFSFGLGIFISTTTPKF